MNHRYEVYTQEKLVGKKLGLSFGLKHKIFHSSIYATRCLPVWRCVPLQIKNEAYQSIEGSEKESKKVHTTDTAQKEDISQDIKLSILFQFQ